LSEQGDLNKKTFERRDEGEQQKREELNMLLSNKEEKKKKEKVSHLIGCFNFSQIFSPPHPPCSC